MNLAIWLQRAAVRHAQRPALLHGNERCGDYTHFYAQTQALAAALLERGIQPDDRIGIFARNHPNVLVAYYAVWLIGAVIVPINNKLHRKEAAWILENSGACLVLASTARGADLAEACPLPWLDLEGEAFAKLCQPGPTCDPIDRSEDDLAWLFYTSGTTGRPKGVRITHGMIAATSLAYLADVDTVLPDDAALYAAPISHGAGLYAPIHVLMGAAHMVPLSGGFDADEVLALSAEQKSTSMFMAPTMVRRLLDRARATGQRGTGIRTIIYGGGPMYVSDIVEAVDWFGPRFVQIYGQGECPMAISSLTREQVADRAHPDWEARLGSVGQAQSVVEIRIDDGTGQPAPHGATGEILVRGAPVMPGYWQNAAATRDALREGWLHTGDLGRMDAEGFLTLLDRSKDVIISGGSNIYSREVEEVLLQHPDVHEVSVIGRADPEWGEVVVAVITPRAGAKPSSQELDAHCLSEMARFKRPKHYCVCDDLPKNNYGKILKTDLRTRLDSLPPLD